MKRVRVVAVLDAATGTFPDTAALMSEKVGVGCRRTRIFPDTR
jgi:hypothetical protein